LLFTPLVAMKRFLLGWAAIATLIGLPIVTDSPALAESRGSSPTTTQRQARPEVKLSLVAEKQVTAGENSAKKPVWQSLKSGESVNPGDRLRYRLTGRNDGPVAARNLVLNQAVPAQMTYVIGSVQASSKAKILFSIDGGKSFVATPLIKVKQLDGKIVEQPAPAETYTHIRWVLGSDIAAKSVVNTSYELRVR
jgi:uncharacterized repeat protein (TIGR01451 family)